MRNHNRTWRKLGLEMLERLQTQWSECGERLCLLDSQIISLMSAADIWFLWYLLRQELRTLRQGAKVDLEKVRWIENCIRDYARQV
ncbi:hypothetical protein JST97_13610 [bacterium]|nr:hypothetical protein [bacterium]